MGSCGLSDRSNHSGKKDIADGHGHLQTSSDSAWKSGLPRPALEGNRPTPLLLNGMETHKKGNLFMPSEEFICDFQATCFHSITSVSLQRRENLELHWP